MSKNVGFNNYWDFQRIPILNMGHTGDIQGTYRGHTGDIQGTNRVY